MVLVRHDQTTNNTYSVSYGHTSTLGTVSFIKWTGSVQSLIGSTSFSSPPTGAVTVMARHVGGVLYGYVNGVLRGQVNQNDYAAYEGVGFRTSGQTQWTDDFYCDDGAAPTFDETVEPIVALAQAQGVSFVGTDTNWTPGTPGSPTFTVDKGTLSNQSVQDATHATADYTPPQADDTARFTDPSTNEFDDVALSTGFQVDAGADIQPILDILGTPPEGHTVSGDQTETLANMTMPETPPDVSDIIDWFVEGFIAGTVPEAILDKLNALYGKLPTDQQILSMETLAQTELAWLNRNLGLLTDDVAAIAGEEELSLRAVINAICGVPNITVSEIKDLIDALTVDGYWTLAGIKAQIDLVRGDPPTDLATIYTAIANIPPLELAEVTDYLDWITNTKTIDLLKIDNEVLGLDTSLDGVHDHVVDGFGALTTNGLNTLQTILDALDTETDQIDTALTAIDGKIDEIDTLLDTELTNIKNSLTNIHADLEDVNQETTALYSWVSTIVSATLPHVNAELDTIKTMIAALPRPSPIWPGQANVSLGAAVALAADVRITGDIDGVIVQLESQPHKLSSFPMGDHHYSYRLGFITFEADAGWLEPWQYLGFDSALYAPRQMRRAAAVRIRYLGDADGTAQPWTNV